MRDLVVALLVAASVPFILRLPHVGVLVYAWLSFMNPHRLTWGFAYSFPFAQLVAALTLGAWLLGREPKRVPLTATTVLLALFTAWFSLTTLFALVPDAAVEKWDRAIKIVLMTVVTLALINTRERLHQLLWVTALSVGFHGIKGGLFAVLTGGQYRVWGPPGSFMTDNNNLALALIMVLPLLYYLHQHTARPWPRRLLLAAMPLVVLATLATYSRGGFLALAAFLLVMWWKLRRKLAITLLAAVGAALALAFMPAHWTERIASIGDYDRDASAMSRFESWGFALDLALERPVVGGGFGAFELNEVTGDFGEPSYLNAHSIYFEVLGEHGFVGLALFLALGASALLLGRRVIRGSRDRPDLAWARDLATALQVGLIGFAVGGAFLNMAFFDLYYHLLAATIITAALVDRAVAETAPATRRPWAPADYGAVRAG